MRSLFFNRKDERFYANGEKDGRKDRKAVPNIGKVYIDDLDDNAALKKAIAESDILINATRAGMSPLEDVLPVPAEFLHRDLVAADVVYNPKETLLLKKAKRGWMPWQLWGGIGMLLWQGAAAFELFTGKRDAGTGSDGEIFSMKHKSTNNFLLALTALIWGSAFAAQSVGMDYLGPFTFNSTPKRHGRNRAAACYFHIEEAGQEKREDQNPGWKPENADHRRHLLRRRACRGEFSPADRHYVYNSGKGGIYHGAVYSDCSDPGAVPREEGRDESVDRCGTCCCGHVFSVHHGWIFYIKGRFSCIFMRDCIFRTYPCDRLLCAESGRCVSVLHPVLCMRDSVCGPHACAGTASGWRNIGSVDAPCLCGGAFLRRGIYPAGNCAEKYRSNCGVSDTQP